MQFKSTELPDVICVEPKVFEDDRGFFFESYRKELFDAQGIPSEFVQDNHSRSKQGSLRGLHYQIRQAQGKLIRVIFGEVYDAAVDLRKFSPTFGHWVGHLLSAENKKQLYIPPGFAHGFYVVSEWAEVVYKTTDYYAPQWERTLLWNDPHINISWPLLDGVQLLLSPKDALGTPLSESEIYE